MNSSDLLQQYFGLSYAHYLTIPRSVLEAMPVEWQDKMAILLKELDKTLVWRPQGCYWVLLRDKMGKFMCDPLAEYRHLVEIKRV